MYKNFCRAQQEYGAYNKQKSEILNCLNNDRNKYCSKCSYPLIPEAFDEIEKADDSRLCEMEEKHLKDMKDLEVKMDQRCLLMDRECYGK